MTCVKHVFARHVVFQFNVKNTIEDQLLEGVTVGMDPTEEWLTTVAVVPAPAVAFKSSTPGVTYVAMERPTDRGFPALSFACEMKFFVKDVDPASGEALSEEGSEEVYALEDLSLRPVDFIAPSAVTNFGATWDEIGAGAEKFEKFALAQYKSVQPAADAVIDFLGLAPCEGTGSVPAKARQHMLLLSGLFVGGVRVLARILLASDEGQGTTLKLAVRSTSMEVTQTVIECIR